MKTNGAASLLKLGFYESHSTAVQSVVLYMKDFRDKRVFDFVALELSLLLERYFNENKIKGSDVIFTFSPRSRKNREKSGFDQAAELSKRCAKHYGACFLNLVRRKYFSKNQKGLDDNKRLKNARESLLPNERFSLSGETVVIVDDVVTTGATVSTCVKAVKMLGAKQIICVSVAKTFERTNNIARS